MLILDEPSEGLDPVSIEELLSTLGAAAADGTTVFFSSHQIAEVERIADHVCIIDYPAGWSVEFSLDEMRQDYRRITLEFPTEPSAVSFNIEGVKQIQSKGRQIVVRTDRNADAVIELARAFRRSVRRCGTDNAAKCYSRA